MPTRKKYAKTVKKHTRAARKNPGKTNQDNAAAQPGQSIHSIEEFISLHATTASSDEFIPNEWPAVDPGRTRIVRGASFYLPATEKVTASSLGPGVDTVLFVDCTFDLFDGISFDCVRPIFYRCRFKHIPRGIASDLPMTLKACHIPRGIASDLPMTLKACHFESRIPLTGRSVNARLELEDVEKEDGDCISLRITDFPSVSVKNSTHNLLLVDCDSVSLEDIAGSGDNELRIEYRYPPAAERDLHTHTLKFTRCKFDAPVYVSMGMSPVAIDFSDTSLDFLSLSHGTVRHIGFDYVSSVGAMEAVECHFIEGYRAARAPTYPIRCSGAVNCDSLTLFKKVRYFPWYAAPFAGFEAFNGIPLVAELHVPPSAERHFDRLSGKVRVSEAKVVGFYRIKSFYLIKNVADGKHLELVPFTPFGTVRSTFDRGYVYREGETVVPKDGFERSGLTCAPGIHGFLTMEEAANY